MIKTFCKKERKKLHKMIKAGYDALSANRLQTPSTPSPIDEKYAEEDPSPFPYGSEFVLYLQIH